ncbi:hypothetical protein BJX65DRAFT_304488 [Aspergillus insuetus]
MTSALPSNIAAHNISSTFPSFALPPELREEVYRHLFWIYPDHRCHIIRSPPGRGVLSRNAFGINKRSYSSPKDDAPYKPRESGSPTLTKQIVHLESARDFLAILHANMMVYEEAVRILYSETFFVAYDDMCEMTLFLKKIGPRRRKLIRRLGFPFASPAVKVVYVLWAGFGVVGGFREQKVGWFEERDEGWFFAMFRRCLGMIDLVSRETVPS